MNAFEALQAEAAKQSDLLLVDSIRLIDATLATLPAGGDDARAHRMVRGAALSVLEIRHPEIIPALDEWALAPDGSDSRSYSDVVCDLVAAVTA